MALIGVILLLIGAGAGVVTYLGAQAAGGTIALTALGFTRTVSPLELALYAAVAVLLVALGWALLSAAARRRARARREDKEAARLAEVEEKAETARLDNERRFEEAGLRDEDLRRRESQLTARDEELGSREAELSRREAEWRERQGPSVADVVTGRAEGNVHDGTASWTDNGNLENRSHENGSLDNGSHENGSFHNGSGTDRRTVHEDSADGNGTNRADLRDGDSVDTADRADSVDTADTTAEHRTRA